MAGGKCRNFERSSDPALGPNCRALDGVSGAAQRSDLPHATQTAPTTLSRMFSATMLLSASMFCRSTIRLGVRPALVCGVTVVVE